MYSDGRYHQTLGYLNIQFGNLDQACLDYLSAIEAFQRDNNQTTAAQLTERLNELNAGQASNPAEPPMDVRFKLEILRLCRLSLRHSRRKQHQLALNILERGLQLSDTLVDMDYQQGQYCAAVVLSMMGKVYNAQRYYLFALASFKAALEAYQSLTPPTPRIQGRIATVLGKIAHIAEITNHPDAAIEYYLDALWYWNSIEHQPQAKQIAQQLNKLCNQPAEVSTF
ncbi:MAG: hypothetical protein AAF572_25215 [Cyanobacteria bacterium P01_B01_bin.77]